MQTNSHQLTRSTSQINAVYFFQSAVCNQHMMHEPNKPFQIMRGICPGGICPGVYVLAGICPRG